jgi:hypothetical protein
MNNNKSQSLKKENGDNQNDISGIQNKRYSSNKKVFLNCSDKSNYSSGSTYIGSYINNKKNGKGKLIVPDQFVYEGNFKDDLFDGYGEYTSKSYNYYGNYSCGKKHGNGKEIDLIKKIEYEGEFKDDKKCGYGKEKTEDGSIYIGDFKDNKKHGQGTLILSGIEDWSYKGEFRDDKISGVGQYKWNKNMEYIGEWENSELSGYGMLIKENTRHIGYFSHNNKHGRGASFYSTKYAILGKWENDLIEGNAIIIPLSDLSQSNNEDNIDNYQFVKASKGEIIENNLETDEVNDFKSSQEFNDLLLLYRNKIYPQFLQNIKKNNNNDFENNH